MPAAGSPDHPASTAPLATLALYEQVADRLRQQILARELEPGAWIDELKLCGELGISRTPLREALKVLAAEGLVTMKLRRGAYVTEMSERDVREAYQLLSLLESDAAAEVATRATDAELAELGELHRALEDALQNPPRRATPFSPPTSASTCACWRSTATAGGCRSSATCAG